MTRIQTRLRRFLRAEDGNISMEFTIIFPLLVFIITGSLVYWDAFRSNSQTAKLAHTISDIMSRHNGAVNNTDMAFLFDLQQKMLAGNLDQRTLRISSICFAQDDHQVLWSVSARSDDVDAFEPLIDTEIPVAILPTMQDQDSVLLVEVSARWQPIFGNVGLGEQVWRNRLVIRPRFVKFIPHETLNPSNVCPVDSLPPASS